MLSDTEIRAALQSAEFKLEYSFLPNAEGGYAFQDPPVMATQNGAATSFFELKQLRSRLALTLGPLVKPIGSTLRISRNVRFEGHRNVVDLRKCKEYALKPQHSAVICTNEHVTLPRDLIGFILGRVSSYNNGLVTVTSFLDSGWNGIVKLLLTNTSRDPVRLCLGLEVGRLFLDRTDSASPDISRVGIQSLHHGMTWNRILADGIDPFPQAISPPGGRAAAYARDLNTFLQKYAGVTLLAAGVALTTGAVRLYDDMHLALSQGSQIPKMERDITSTISSSTVGGSLTIPMPPTLDPVTTKIAVPQGRLYRGSDSTAILSTDSPNVIFSATPIQTTDGRVIINGTARRTALPNANSEKDVAVKWIYIP